MNDFERIYTVIKSQYSCGVPYYNYDSCTYDSLSNMYYQQGVLSLQNSTGYSNVPFNDIPVACGFPNVVYRQCVPSEPPDEEEEKDETTIPQTSGFRINVNSAYVYPENNGLILKNPVDFNMNYLTTEGVENIKNALYLLEKKGYSSCIKHMLSGKYVGFDNNNNFILIDNCSDNNTFIYDSDNLHLKYKEKCVNPTTVLNIIPNDTPLTISDCNQNIDVILEKLTDQIASYVNLKEISISYIQSTVTIPSTYSNKIVSKYSIPSKYSNGIVYDIKLRYSNASILSIIKTKISSQSISNAYLSYDRGLTWIKLNDDSIFINDGDMSYDGKYITLTTRNEIFIYNNAVLNLNVIKYNTSSTQNYKVIMSKLGNVQCIYTPESGLQFISIDYGKTIIRSISTIGIVYSIFSSFNGDIVFLLSYKTSDKSNKIYSLSTISILSLSEEIPITFSNIIKTCSSYDCKNVYILTKDKLYYNHNYLNKDNWIINDLENIKESLIMLYGKDETNFYGDMVISYNGKFVFLFYKIYHSDNISRGLIFYSNNYGEKFTQLRTNNNFINNNLNNYTSIDCSIDGLTLVISDNEKIYTTTLDNEKADDIIEKNTVISIPENQYKYLFEIQTNENFTRVIKNGKTLYRISDSYIYDDNKNSLLISIPSSIGTTNISSICKSNDNSTILYSVNNNLYNKNSDIVLNTTEKIVYISFQILSNSKKMFIALNDKINYSYDGVSWVTYNMISKKWKMAYIVPQLKNNEFTIYCVEEYGKFYFSYDSGLTWKSNEILENYFWITLDCSQDGKILIACVKNNLPLISYDGGLSFNFINFEEKLTDVSGNYIKQFVDCSISNDGKFILVVIDNGRILSSYDYGKNWEYYGDYYFDQKSIDINKSNILYTFSSSFKNTIQSGFTYSDSNILEVFNKSVFSSYDPSVYSNQSVFKFNAGAPTYTGFPLRYIGSANTIISNISNKFDYIQINFNYFFNIKNFYIGKFTNINSFTIVGSNDDINYQKIFETVNLIFDRSSNIKMFNIPSYTGYYKFYRILLKINSINQIVEINDVNLEGSIFISTSHENISSSKWNNVVIKSDSIFTVKNNNSLLQGFVNHPIFVGNVVDRIVNDLTITTNQQLSGDLYVNNLTINNLVTLKTNGFRIFCKGILTNNGTIRNNGYDITNNNSILGKGQMGGIGGKVGIFPSPVATSGSNSSYTIVEANGGKGGDSIRASETLYGGLGGNAELSLNNEIFSNPNIAIIGKDKYNGNVINGGAGGGGGAAGSSTNGGKGGNGGGIIMICASEIINNGLIDVSGEPGQIINSTFTATRTTFRYGACGGGGGGGGTIILVTKYTSKLVLDNKVISGFKGFNFKGGDGGRGERNLSIDFQRDTSGNLYSGTSGQNGQDGRLVVVFV